MEDAMRRYPQKDNTQFTVTWKPFFLNPHIPPQGVPLKQYIESIYGKARSEVSSRHLKEMGEKCGIQFREDRYIVLTTNSHRLVELAKRQGKQDECIEAVFHAYFEECKNINDPDILQQIADNIGVTGATKEYFESDQDVQLVLDQVKESRIRRISGVPFFVMSTPGVKQKIAFSGAQPAEAFLDAFEELESLSSK